jgi:hypothetical protein
MAGGDWEEPGYKNAAAIALGVSLFFHALFYGGTCAFGANGFYGVVLVWR